MAEWKLEIKRLAEDFCISQVAVNRILKKIEGVYGQGKREREIPKYYKGNLNEFLYDKAQREIMSLIYA